MPPLNKKAKKHKGFTLIELSIVLVIIGLLVGGVLYGNDLMRSFQINQLYNQVESTKAAIMTYKSRYGYYPGDDPDAWDHFGGGINAADGPCGTNNAPNDWSPTNGCNGNGNGVIGNREIIRAWHHLQLAGIVDYKLDTTRSDLINTGHGAASNALRDQWPNTIVPSFGLRNTGVLMNNAYTGCRIGLVIASSNDGGGNYANDYRGLDAISAAEALMLDKKYDDGLPASGRIVASGSSWGGCGPYDGDHIPSTYDVNRPNGCALHWCLIK